jgi:drug/metabolite transporter (DMT)-like permease
MCIIGSMMGMLFILGNREELMELTNMRGIGYGFLAAGLYASVILMNKLLKDLSGLDITLMQLGIASIVLFPYVFATEGVGQIHMNQKSFLLLVTLGILHTGIAYFLYFTSMQKTFRTNNSSL